MPHGTRRDGAGLIEPRGEGERRTHPLLGRRIAVAHDWLVGLRGGERVLDRVIRACREAGAEVGPIVTLFESRTDDGPVRLTPAIDETPRVVSRLSRLAGRDASGRRWLLPLYPAAVEELSALLARAHRRTPFDLLISTSSVAMKSMRAPSGVPHLCYCHTPARYLWDRVGDYGGTSAVSMLRWAGLRVAGPALRRWDRGTADRPTRLLANSNHTAGRILEAFGRGAQVLHPPVDTDFFTPDPGAAREPRWLVVSALEPYKRIGLAVEAARLAGRPLDVVGDGSEWATLRRLGARSPHLRLLGRVSQQRLRELYRTSSVLLFPQVEDFGIVALEAQACGLPVVAYRGGGAVDSVLDGRTGLLVNPPTPEVFAEAGLRAEAALADAAAVLGPAHAARFGTPRFDAAVIEHAVALLDDPG